METDNNGARNVSLDRQMEILGCLMHHRAQEHLIITTLSSASSAPFHISLLVPPFFHIAPVLGMISLILSATQPPLFKSLLENVSCNYLTILGPHLCVS